MRKRSQCLTELSVHIDFSLSRLNEIDGSTYNNVYAFLYIRSFPIDRIRHPGNMISKRFAKNSFDRSKFTNAINLINIILHGKNDFVEVSKN